MGDVVEAIKFFGGLAGIISAGFLVYDRLIRSRPLVFPVLGQHRAELCIRNVAAETVIVDKITAEPSIVGFIMADDLVSTVRAAAEGIYPDAAGEPHRTFVVLAPGEERRIGILKHSGFKTADKATKIKVRCVWRNSRKPFPFERHARVITSVRDIESLEKAALAKADAG